MSKEFTDIQRQMAACLMIKTIAYNAKLPQAIEHAAMEVYRDLLAKETSRPSAEVALRLQEQFCEANQLHMPTDDIQALLILMEARCNAMGLV